MSPCLAAMLRGMRYWQQGWSLTKRQGKCSVLHITAEKSDPGSVGRGVVDTAAVVASLYQIKIAQSIGFTVHTSCRTSTLH